MNPRHLCTFIIPFHLQFKGEAKEKLIRAINSFNIARNANSIIHDDFKLIIATTNPISISDINDVAYIEILECKNKSTYSELVNAAIEKIEDSEYVSILEYDDELTKNSLKCFVDYNKYSFDNNEEVDIFTGLAFVLASSDDNSESRLVGISNEPAFAPGVSEEYGKFDFNMMLRTNFIFLNGCFIKRNLFDQYGKFKENFEMFYDYEFILRMIYNGANVKAIPKITHLHYLSNNGAFAKFSNEPHDVREKWLNAARRELFFEEDREIEV